MLLAQAERRLGIAERLARFIPDRRTPERVKHAIPDMLRARIFAIACGYEDCNDFGPLRADPAFKLACGHLPDGWPLPRAARTRISSAVWPGLLRPSLGQPRPERRGCHRPDHPSHSCQRVPYVPDLTAMQKAQRAAVRSIQNGRYQHLS